MRRFCEPRETVICDKNEDVKRLCYELANDPYLPGVIAIDTEQYHDPYKRPFHAWPCHLKNYPIEELGDYTLNGPFVRSIQIARYDGLCVVFDLLELKYIHEVLKRMLECDELIKIGYAWRSDKLALERTDVSLKLPIYCDLDPQLTISKLGIFEYSNLKYVVFKLFGKTLQKNFINNQITIPHYLNRSLKDLGNSFVTEAATDAICHFDVCLKLESFRDSFKFDISSFRNPYGLGPYKISSLRKNIFIK